MTSETPSTGEPLGPLVRVHEPGRAPLLLVIAQTVEVGRDCNGLLVTDPQVSRRHVSLRPNAERLAVTDLGSRNGTTVDGIPLNGTVDLEPGQIVRLGATTIELVRTDASRPTERRARDEGPRTTSIDLVAAAAVADPDVVLVRPASRDSGTVTIVFSDIEGSTQQSIALGDDAWMELLDVHNRIIRHHLHRHDGTEVKAQGDGFMLTFPSARSAAHATIDIQRSLADHARSHPGSALRVRMGIHTGEAIVGDHGDLFGRHVVMAARVANCAGGQEILASSLVREIVDSRGDLRFGEPRSVVLKGLDGPHIVHPLLWTRG